MSGTGEDLVGFECKLYRNSASYATPTWSEITIVRDLTMPLADDELDASSRGGGGWKEGELGLRDGSLEFDLIYDPSDANYAALQSAKLNRTTVELLCLDGPQGTAGSQGLRCTYKVVKFSRKEELNNVVMTEVRVVPAKNADAAPAWYVAS